MMEGSPQDIDLRQYLSAVAVRLAELLVANPEDAGMWMDEMAREAEQRGWVGNHAHIRRHSPWVFAMDLFDDNMIAYEHMKERDIWLSDPDSYDELCQFMDIIL